MFLLLQQLMPVPSVTPSPTPAPTPLPVTPEGLPMAAWIGIGVGLAVIAIVLIVALRFRSRMLAVQEMARQLREAPPAAELPKKKEKEPEVAPPPEAKPVLGPGEKFVFEEPGKPARVEPAAGVPLKRADEVLAPAPRSLSEGLDRTREGFVGRIRSLISGRAVDASIVDDLEEVLFTSDLGVKTANDLLERMREQVSSQQAKDPAALTGILKDGIREKLGEKPAPSTFADSGAKPWVVMVVGVNGVGKTTTIGKLAKQIVDGRFGGGPKKVLLGAGDTFRAAAAEQLEIWGERAGVEVVANKEGTDPSAVAFDAAKAALARGVDVLILDTAGRLHTKANLMEELKKVKRVVGREIPGAPHEVLLVVDATTGQNALNQAKEFNDGVGLTGIVLTKLDGTAKGGIVVGIRDELKIPVRFIGIGEGVDDLQPFDPDAFVDALFA